VYGQYPERRKPVIIQSGSPQNPNSSSIQKTANALGAQISNTLPAIADEVRPAVLLQRDADARFGSCATGSSDQHFQPCPLL
jgi:hypothetical protein